MPDDLRLIRLLLSRTMLSKRLGDSQTDKFQTTVGTPQGDSLSPVLFIMYLDAALRDVIAASPRRCPGIRYLPLDVVYADDTDFVSTSSEWLTLLEPIPARVLKDWNLVVNEDNTELTKLTCRKTKTAGC